MNRLSALKPMLLLTSLGLSACSMQATLPDVPSAFSQETLKQAKTLPILDTDAKAKLSLAERIPASEETPVTTRKLFSFHARNLPVEQAMSQFAQTYGLNIVLDNDVRASTALTVDFRNLTLEKALEALLEANGLSWEWNDGLLRVTRQQTKTFALDYLRLKRTGSATSTTNGSAGGSSGGSSSQDTTKFGVTRSDSIDFWDEVEKQLTEILTKDREDYAAQDQQPSQETTTVTDRTTNTSTTSTKMVAEKAGRLTINRLAGTIQVTTTSARMRAVENYIEAMKASALRQVYIDVKIIEVDLNADAAFGVDWSKIDMGALTLASSTSFTTSAAGTSVPASTLAANYSQNFAGTGLVKSVTNVISALQQQGNVHVVSQPRIRTMNNQTAIVKSGTDRTFYTTQTNVTTTSGTTTTTTTNQPTTVTDGIVLSVTPQISADDKISLDVTPVISRVSGVDTSPDGNSNAPRLDIKQATTMVRVNDGETVVIGGLIQETDETTRREIPGLGSAPVIGNLFGTSYNGKTRRELVIVLTPYILR